MKNSNKEIFFPLFALFVIFSDELFYSLMSIVGIPLESGMKGRLASVIAGVAYLMMAGDIIKKRFNKKNKIQLAVLLLLLVLYLITRFFYSPGNANYNATLLVYCALCIPAAYVGMRLARGGYEAAMLRYLPFFIVIVSLIVGYAVVVGFMHGEMLGFGNERTDGLNYQNASYFLSYCYAYSVFYVFFLKNEHQNLWQKIVFFIIILMMFFCAVGTIVGGGRGAFVYLVLVSVYLVWRIMKGSRGSSKVGNYILLTSSIVVLIYLANYFNIFESAGASRVVGSLLVDDERNDFTRLAMASFSDSPIWGHGIGSVWWEVGFYSHNMFQDFLVEMGVVGTFAMTIVIVKMFVNLIRGSKYSNFEMFMLLLFAGYLLQDAFSGYWFSSFILFLVYGYVFGKKWPQSVNVKKV